MVCLNIFRYTELSKYIELDFWKENKRREFVSEIIIENLNKFKNELDKNNSGFKILINKFRIWKGDFE